MVKDREHYYPIRGETNMESTFSSCAYCWKNEDSWDKILCYKCDGCQKKVHFDCIRSKQPSSLLGDTFFNFKCQACGEDGKEEFVRSNMSWHNVVMLTLYNLHKTSQGRCGYFHWKGHIGLFIDQHWNTLFGYHRKKTTVWMGTVAGTLSTGCPEYFLSGTHVGQPGHWRLAQVEPPTAHCEKKKQNQRKKTHTATVDLNPDKRKCRRSGESPLAAAVGLKEKRSTLPDTKGLKRQKFSQSEEISKEKGDFPSSSSKKVGKRKEKIIQTARKSLFVKEENSPDVNLNCSRENMEEPYLSDSQISLASSKLSLAKNSSYSSSLGGSVKEEEVITQFDNVDHFEDFVILANDIEDLDLEVMEDSIDPRPPSPDMDIMLSADIGQTSYMVSGKSPVSADKTSSFEVKEEMESDSEPECPSENNTRDSDEEMEDKADEEEEKQEKGEYISNEKKKLGRPNKKRKMDDTASATPPPQLKRISLFEEHELLQKLNDMVAKQKLEPDLAQFRRKLICNQTNREFGLPVFDLERQMDKLARLDKFTSVPNPQQQPFFRSLPSKIAETKETRDLDRFMIHASTRKMESRSYTSFYQRLVGFRDHELTPVVSPYTTRVLLPFIWRNTEISRKPLKLKLLQEVLAYPHRNNPSWVQPPTASLDYCYIRPEHVPSVNALCREFFWPGIDVSECLQYPDFSCVVLYRKIVIAFAFMVPDRGYNEAYISFIFTHPEWRGAGIASFMLYHLIQTCMGKDVLLHVSVTNPAMLLYQKFGFKCQELILNFYHKYFPLNSKESTHAFLMRLSR